MAMIRPETEMKDSGVQWIGRLPKNWDVARLKFIKSDDKYAIVDGPFGSAISTNDYVDEGVPLVRITNLVNGNVVDNSLVYITEEHAESINRSKFGLNDIIFAKTGGTVGKCAVNRLFEYGILSSSCVKISISSKYDYRYFYHFFSTIQFNEALRNSCNGTTRDTINLQPFSNLNCPIPPLSEQQAIADYLDETCSKIDAIIAEAKASIEEYKELKQAVILDTISHGLRKNATLSPSKIKGIEKMPVVWESRKLKLLINFIESGVSVNAANEPASKNEYGVLKTSCVSKMVFLPNENKNVNLDEYARVKCPVKGNTIIVSRMNTPELVGACAYSEKDIDNLFLPDRLWQVHFNVNVQVKYVYYCLISAYIRDYYSSLSTGTSSSMQNISQGQFMNATIPYPPVDEQKEIVDFLDKRTVEIDSLIVEKQSLIEDLEAYKKSLIYEVVTGKRRVV